MVLAMNLELIAKIIEAEAGVLPYRGKVAVAQCIYDNDCDYSLFTVPHPWYSSTSMMAARDVFEDGKRRFPDAKLLQFRSFAHYAKDGEPDFEKIYNTIPSDLIYLGQDSANDQWGHFYFGKKVYDMKNFKMLLMAGHGRNVNGTWDPGAVGNGYQEANLARELVHLVKLEATSRGLYCDVAPDRNHFSFFLNGGKYDIAKYTIVCELHFNSFSEKDTIGDGVKKGTMFYIDQSETGHSVEDAILNKMYEIGATKAWDGVVVTQRQYPNGLLVQRKVREQGVSHHVLECCFVSDLDDMRWYEQNKKAIAKAYIDGIIEGYALHPAEQFEPYMVFVDVSEISDHFLNIRKVPNGDIVDKIEENMTLTIVAEQRDSNGTLWGKLKSGAGWISLAYTSRV